MKLAGRTAVVTGAASGIGAATLRLFVREGARVAAVDRDADGLRAQSDALGSACLPCPADVADPEAVRAAAAEILGALGDIHILVTAAGVAVDGGVLDTTERDWDRAFDVNAKGTYLWIRAVLPGMVRARTGSIITVASQLALAGGRGNAVYIASKGAVISLTRAVALDHAADGVRANVLVPGAIETPMLSASFARAPRPALARQQSQARHPMGRLGRSEEVAAAALFLACDDASFTTGALLPVDGGWLAG